MLNDHERCAIYKEHNKTKLRFVKKFIWIRDKQRCRIAGLRQDLTKYAKEKKRRKNARDTQKKLDTAKQKAVFYIVAADVKALYPSLYRDTVTKALECALEKHSDYSAEARKIIVELNKICLNNVDVVTQYGDQLYIQKSGIITGDNHSVSLANICCALHPTADFGCAKWGRTFP